MSPDRAAPAGDREGRVEAAIAAVGEADRDDYVIAPAAHAGSYGETAPALAPLLRSSDVRVAAERYEMHDARAREGQARFDTTSRRAQNAVVAAGGATALVLVAGSLSGVLGDTLTDAVLILATTGAVVAGAAATMWIHRTKEGRLLERWMEERARAETTRLEYFRRVVEAEGPDPLLQLEYFRRYQLDVQRSYYRVRSNDHRRAADRSLDASTAGMAIAAAASGLAGVLGVVDAAWTALAGLALAAQAWSARAANAEATRQSRRNAERYGRTHESLDRLYERLSEVRMAVAGGDREVMRRFVEAVHEQISVEHRQWLEDMTAVSQAVGRLEELLARYREEAGTTPGSGGAAPP